MKRNDVWSWLGQWAVVLLGAFALKLYYSEASVEQLRWILAPTTALVEGVSGTSFAFEAYAGYLSEDRRFLIAPSCAGVNFLITAFLLLAARRLLREGSSQSSWGFIPAAALIAYGVTLVANTVRIVFALRAEPEGGWLSADELHRAEGILVYSGFLLLLFVVSERLSAARRVNLLRQSAFPLFLYYTTTIGIPLANGGYRQGPGFWKHAAFVFLIPPLLLLPFALCRRLYESGESGESA